MKNEKVMQLGGKTYIKAKVVMLATEKESKINDTNQGLLYNNPYYIGEFQHLYFLSEEEIKEGDWIYSKDFNHRIEKVTAVFEEGYNVKTLNGLEQYCPKVNTTFQVSPKKIIATTDGLLKHEVESGQGVGTIKYFIPRPSNEFLQAYCRANGKIEEVLVEVEGYYSGNGGTDSNFTASAYSYFIGYKLKISPDNTITTKRVEGLYNAQDLIYAVSEIASKLGYAGTSEKMKVWNEATREWMSENL